MVRFKRASLILIGMTLAIWLSFWFLKSAPSTDIVILIDRAPNLFTSNQSADLLSRRILPLLNESHYSLSEEKASHTFVLSPRDPRMPKLRFQVVKDELTRAILFLSGRADVLFNSVSLSKTAWFKTKGYQTIENPGLLISFLGFNLDDPHLSDKSVRLAIAHALPVSEWMEYKHYHLTYPIKGIPNFDLDLANRLLDQGPFKTRKDGVRFTLDYLTTQASEGYEFAKLVQKALKKVKIEVVISTIESSLFYERIKSRKFALFSSRLIRSSANESLASYVVTGGIRNYFNYHNETINQAFDQNEILTWDEISKPILLDLPFLPLFGWFHAAILSNRLLPYSGPPLDDSFRFLTHLRLK